MSLSKAIRSRSNGRKRKTKSEITTTEHVDASASCSVLVYNTHDGTQEVYTKGFAMTGLSDIAPTSAENSAKITVSFDLSSKSYGNGAGIMCSVTLNCKQDEESIKLGYDLARSICETEGEAALFRAQDTFNRVTSES
jgi:hypothetical protein